MEHYQRQFKCGVCGREIIIDIQSIGVSHDFIMAATCKECGLKVGGTILGDKIEKIEFKEHGN